MSNKYHQMGKPYGRSSETSTAFSSPSSSNNQVFHSSDTSQLKNTYPNAICLRSNLSGGSDQRSAFERIPSESLSNSSPCSSSTQSDGSPIPHTIHRPWLHTSTCEPPRDQPSTSQFYPSQPIMHKNSSNKSEKKPNADHYINSTPPSRGDLLSYSNEYFFDKSNNRSSSSEWVTMDIICNFRMKANAFIKLSPTVVPAVDFDPRSDAKILHKNMKNFVINVKSIIRLLANRTNSQRLEISEQYDAIYGQDLIEDLKSETLGDFKELLVAMMTPLPIYYANELHKAIKGSNTDTSIIIEIACTISNHDINLIKEIYKKLYGKSLELHFSESFSSDVACLIISLFCGTRNESLEADPLRIEEDVEKLLKYKKLRNDVDKIAWSIILSSRSTIELNLIFVEYEKITGTDIEETIEKGSSEDLNKELLNIVKCIKNSSIFFAELLYENLVNFQRKSLMRLVLTRAEIDMEEIKSFFLRRYRHSLCDFIIGSPCCSFCCFKGCLIELIS